MDGAHHIPAGPEWVYCRRLAYDIVKADINSVFVSVFLEDTEEWRTPSINDIRRSLSHRAEQKADLDTCLELEPGRYRIRYEAYLGAGSSVAIPDTNSLLKLLQSIQCLGGLPVPCTGFDASITYPPLVRLLASPIQARERRRSRSPAAGPGHPGGRRGSGDEGQNQGTRDRRRLQDAGRGVRGETSGTGPARGGSGDGRRTGRSRRPDDGADAPRDGSAPSQQPATLPLPRLRQDNVDLRQDNFEQRVKMRLSEGLNRRLGHHKQEYHDLYAKIAGISRDRIDARNPEHGYRPPYSAATLYPHQTYPTGWVLGTPDKMVHYLADRPGMGKTFEALELVIRMTLILSNGKAIEQERAQLSTSKHQPDHMHDVTHQWTGIRKSCAARTLERYGFECQCDPNSTLRKLQVEKWFAKGYMLVLTPSGVAATWEREARKFLGSELPRLPHSGRPIQIIGVSAQPGMQDLVKGYILGNQDDVGLGTIIISSHEKAMAKVRTAFHHRDPNQPPPNVQLHHQPSIIVWDEVHLTRSLGTNPSVIVNGLMRVAPDPVHLLVLSGTPLTSGPADFQVVENIAKNPRTADHVGVRRYRKYTEGLASSRQTLDQRAAAVRTSLDISKARRGQPLIRHAQANASRLLDEYDTALWEYTEILPLLQRSGRSDYFGTPVPVFAADPPTVERFDVPMNGPQKAVAGKYKALLQAMWRRALESSSNLERDSPEVRDNIIRIGAARSVATQSQFIDASLAGLVPGLAPNILRRNPETQRDKFRSQEVKRVFANPNTAQRMAVMGSEYWLGTRTMFNIRNQPATLHPKVARICGIIDEMLGDETKHDLLGRREAHLPKKAVICAPNPWEAFILTVFLFWKYPDKEFTFVGSGMGTDVKDRLLGPFMRDPRTRVPADDDPSDPIALVSTIRHIGTSLNLIRCSYCITTSPLRSGVDESQLFARINRMGQVHETHSYVLCDDGNPTDVMAIHSRAGRALPEIPEAEKGSGYRFLFDDLNRWDDVGLLIEEQLDATLVIDISTDAEEGPSVEEGEDNNDGGEGAGSIAVQD